METTKQELETKKETPVKTETPTEVKKEQKASKDKPKVKKEVAVVRSKNLPISLKHSMFISRFIRGKKVDDAISDLQKVVALKMAVPFKGEIPHRKGPIMSGRYPVDASKEFILVLRSLKGNITVNGMDLDKAKITTSNPSWASRPMRRGGRHGKRVNLLIEAREMEAKKNG